MFRCITDIKGLVFNLDSFQDFDVLEIVEMFSPYKLLFMTSKDEFAVIIEEKLGSEYLYKIEKFQMLFAPNQRTHSEVLRRLHVNATEMLYVSKSLWFLDKAAGFMGGTVWISEEINYTAASSAPDLICRNLSKFQEALQCKVEGFYGETYMFPKGHPRAGVIIPVSFPINENSEIPLYMLGRYFGYTQYMSQLHPYSTAIYWNKKAGKRAYGVFNEKFAFLISRAVESIKRWYEVDGICAVPPRPGKENRFQTILEKVCEKCGIDNYGTFLKCIKDYPPQKGLSAEERRTNIHGAFSIEGDIHGKKIIIVDDIISTGSTLRECVEVLKMGGAEEVYALALAINQQSWNYWSSEPVQVCCHDCGEKMHLLVNSRDLTYFYSCYSCRAKTKDFSDARREIINKVNAEFKVN